MSQIPCIIPMVTVHRIERISHIGQGGRAVYYFSCGLTLLPSRVEGFASRNSFWETDCDIKSCSTTPQSILCLFYKLHGFIATLHCYLLRYNVIVDLYNTTRPSIAAQWIGYSGFHSILQCWIQELECGGIFSETVWRIGLQVYSTMGI